MAKLRGYSFEGDTEALWAFRQRMHQFNALRGRIRFARYGVWPYPIGQLVGQVVPLCDEESCKRLLRIQEDLNWLEANMTRNDEPFKEYKLK